MDTILTVLFSRSGSRRLRQTQNEAQDGTILSVITGDGAVAVAVLIFGTLLIRFRLCILMHAVHSGRYPVYMNKVVQPASSRGTRVGLRSASSSDYVIPRLRIEARRARLFHFGLAAWNPLPTHVREDIDQQRCKKTP